MKQTYTMYIYKTDRRKRNGERAVSTTVWHDRDDEGMLREAAELAHLYPAAKGYRIFFVPTMKTVRNLMSGAAVEIPHDTPRCCDPSSELYWSM